LEILSKKREKIHPHPLRLLYLLRGAGIQGGKKMNRALQPHEEYLRALLCPREPDLSNIEEERCGQKKTNGALDDFFPELKL
jgi:hypothetical protein